MSVNRCETTPFLKAVMAVPPFPSLGSVKSNPVVVYTELNRFSQAGGLRNPPTASPEIGNS